MVERFRDDAVVPISVYVRQESGEQVPGEIDQPLAYAPLLSRDDRPEEFPMLAHVDPYGTTVLNALQVRVLLEELDAIRARHLDEESRCAIDSLTYLCHLATGRPHRFLWFLGD